MKSLLISIRTKWTAKILNGEKTIEIRKTAPKEWVDYLSGKTKEKQKPMTGYIYCTNDKTNILERNTDEPFNFFVLNNRKHLVFKLNKKHIGYNAKVIAKFTLREVERIYRVGAWDEDPCVDAFSTNKMDYDELLNKSCLKETEMDEYLTSDKEFVGYAYHISDLQIFDKLKNIWEFEHIGGYMSVNDCPKKERGSCNMGFGAKGYVGCERARLKRPPQSWCYVETRE